MSECYCGEFDRPTIAPDEFGETCFHDTDKCEVPPVSVPIETVLRLTKARAEKAEAALEQAKQERDAAVEVAQGLSANFGDRWTGVCESPEEVVRELKQAQAAIQRVQAVCDKPNSGPSWDSYVEGYNDAISVVQSAMEGDVDA